MALSIAVVVGGFYFPVSKIGANADKEEKVIQFEKEVTPVKVVFKKAKHGEKELVKINDEVVTYLIEQKVKFSSSAIDLQTDGLKISAEVTEDTKNKLIAKYGDIFKFVPFIGYDKEF